VWALEKRSFEYWYDVERFGYQGNLSNAVMKSRKDRLEVVLAYHSGSTEASLENLERVLSSFAESLLASLQQIMDFRGAVECGPPKR